PDHISIKFAHNAIRRLGYDGSTPGKSKHTMHGFRHLFTNISLTAGKDTLTTDLALGHISRAALQRAGFSSLHHYLPPTATASKSGANSPNGTAAATAKHTKPPPKPRKTKNRLKKIQTASCPKHLQ
ncbi:TPA: integrase, partial [Neisseria meningitidis]|nr:integrase [Neisseria meningitidis]